MRLAFIILSVLWASPVLAATCLSVTSTPTYPANQSTPVVCDTHGTQRVMMVDSSGVPVAALNHEQRILLAKQIRATRERVQRMRTTLAALQREEQILFAELSQYVRVSQ